MTDDFLIVMQWYGAITSVIAAAVISADLGRRATGWAFVLFVSSSLTLIAWGFLQQNTAAIGVQSALMLLINLFGVYRYLIRKG